MTRSWTALPMGSTLVSGFLNKCVATWKRCRSAAHCEVLSSARQATWPRAVCRRHPTIYIASLAQLSPAIQRPLAAMGVRPRCGDDSAKPCRSSGVERSGPADRGSVGRRWPRLRYGSDGHRPPCRRPAGTGTRRVVSGVPGMATLLFDEPAHGACAEGFGRLPHRRPSNGSGQRLSSSDLQDMSTSAKALRGLDGLQRAV